MNKDIIAVLEYLERERGIKKERAVEAIKDSLLAAARKSVTDLLNVEVHINPKTGDIEVTAEKEVVDKVTIPEEEVSLEEALAIDPKAELGKWIPVPCTPKTFGRIAAQVARQTITQKIRAAEQENIQEEYRHRINEIVSGKVKRIGKNDSLIIDLGKVDAVLPRRFYPNTEKYKPGDIVQALIFEVSTVENGEAHLILSRSHTEFVRGLFEREVPEIHDESVQIEKIVRDPGYRVKISVTSSNSKVDPVGSCVGVRGVRIKKIIAELNNEKIDIFPYSKDPIQQLSFALAPIEIRKFDLNEENRVITIVVDDENYPAALGKRGMNARLNGELIEYELEIRKISDYQQMAIYERKKLAMGDSPSLDEPLSIEGMSHLIIDSLVAAGFDTSRKVLNATPEELSAIPEISIEMATKILEEVFNKKRETVG